jgi:hypothetical protein
VPVQLKDLKAERYLVLVFLRNIRLDVANQFPRALGFLRTRHIFYLPVQCHHMWDHLWLSRDIKQKALPMLFPLSSNCISLKMLRGVFLPVREDDLDVQIRSGKASLVLFGPHSE